MILITNNIKNMNESSFELVERKGIGHPDTICDAIAEKASQYYSRYFYENYGGIAHHWFDKVMLLGGESDFSFGKGEIRKPYQVIFAGKAAKTYKDKNIPIDDILKKATIDVLSSCLTDFNAEEHVKIINRVSDYHGAGRKSCRYRPLNKDDLFSFGQGQMPVSNDCNLVSGYAPLSYLEMLVLNVERFINGKQFKQEFPEIGWDVKIVGRRVLTKCSLLVNIPFLSQYVAGEKEYFNLKKRIQEKLYTYIKNICPLEVNININPQDKSKNFYLTVLGSVADTGDVGVVGRGNRINGLITPMRSMSIEAPAGKNPIDHTGKLYGILVHNLAYEIANMLNADVDINLFTAKNSALDKPDFISIALPGWTGQNSRLEKRIIEMTEDKLNNIEEITKSLVFEGRTLW